jgi:microcystin-dependent protein
MNPPLPPSPPLLVPGLLPPLVPGTTTAGGCLPVGTVLAFAGLPGAHSPPLEASGFMVCDGRSLDKDEFEELFNVIAYTYSATDGGQNFQIPNLQGYFLRGVDPNGQVDPDLDVRTSVSGHAYSGVGSLQPSAFQLHEHKLAAAAATSQPSQSGTEAGTTTTTFENTTEVVPDQSDVTLSTSKFESRPVNVALYFILRFTSEPSRGLAERP